MEIEMNKKYFFVILFLMFVSTIQATPDRQRYIIDTLIGLNGENVIVHQKIYDNMQSHQIFLLEEYLIEKYMENGNTVIVDMIKIAEQDKIEEILLQKYNGSINRIDPDIMFNKLEILDNGYIEIPSELRSRYYLKNYIPKELINCTIKYIVDIYFIGEYIYLTIDLSDNVNIYRKIIMIKFL
jgi:hypothetical protein